MSILTSGLALYDLASGNTTGNNSPLVVSGSNLYLSGVPVPTHNDVVTISGNANGFFNILTGASGALLADIAGLSGVLTNAVHSNMGIGSGGASYGSVLPVTVYIKNVTMPIAGAPADIAIIPIPSGITRWKMWGSNSSFGPLGGVVLTESATGVIGGLYQIWDSAGGSGNLMSALSIAPGLPNSINTFGANTSVFSTSSVMYLHQASNATSTGIASFYINIQPLP